MGQPPARVSRTRRVWALRARTVGKGWGAGVWRVEPVAVRPVLVAVLVLPVLGQVRRLVAVPVMGRSAAGTPISAIQTYTHAIPVPFDLVGGGEHFALEVRGDSMIDAGILDGDTVVIKRSESADSGDIVVALVDEEEATLKRLRKRGASVALEAANPAYETRIFGPDRVKVQGRLVGLIRRY